MKISPMLLATITAFISQSIVAEKLRVINHYDFPVTCYVQTTNNPTNPTSDNTFEVEVPGNRGASPIIDIGDKPLTYILWENVKKIGLKRTNLPLYREDNNGRVPLQKNGRNFFNINKDGTCSHNFNGTKVLKDLVE